MRRAASLIGRPEGRPRRGCVLECTSVLQDDRAAEAGLQARAITGRNHSTDFLSTLLEQASYAQPAHDPGGDRTRGLRIKSSRVEGQSRALFSYTQHNSRHLAKSAFLRLPSIPFLFVIASS